MFKEATVEDLEYISKMLSLNDQIDLEIATLISKRISLLHKSCGLVSTHIK